MVIKEETMVEFILILVIIAILYFVFITSRPKSDDELKPQKHRSVAADKEILVTIAQYIHLVDAQLSHIRLESEDIESYLADENIILMNPLYSLAVGGVKIQVKSSDVTKTLEALNAKPETIEEEKDAYKGTGESCPKCGSYNIYPYTYFYGTLSVITILLFSLPVLAPRKRMYCFSCKHKWKSSQQQNGKDNDSKTTL